MNNPGIVWRDVPSKKKGILKLDFLLLWQGNVEDLWLVGVDIRIGEGPEQFKLFEQGRESYSGVVDK